MFAIDGDSYVGVWTYDAGGDRSFIRDTADAFIQFPNITEIYGYKLRGVNNFRLNGGFMSTDIDGRSPAQVAVANPIKTGFSPSPVS